MASFFCKYNIVDVEYQCGIMKCEKNNKLGDTMNELYKLILVDDEDDVRGRILSKISDESGFVVVGKAGNGYDALELIEEHHPHVVITDIKMPFINGIELARIIRRDYPTTKVAFISGYDEFEYAREAIKLNVVSYLMKPITSADIDDFLMRLKVSLDDEFDFLNNSQSLEVRYRKSIPILINSYLNNYIQKKKLSLEDISRLNTYGLELGPGNYIVGNISVTLESDLEEPKLFIKTLSDKVFKNFDEHITFLTPDNVVFIVRAKVLISSREIDLKLFEVLKYAEEYRNMYIQFGVSKVFHDFLDFPQAYFESQQSLKHSQYFNLGQIIYYEDIEDIEKKNIIIKDSDLTELNYQLKYGEEDSIRRLIENLLHPYSGEKNVVVDFRLFNIKMANALIDFSSSLSVHLSDVVEGDFLETIPSHKNINEYIEFIIEIVVKIRNLNVKSQVNKTEQIIEDAVVYIEHNFTDSALSLEVVSEHLNISISYLSMLFSKMKGITFNKYLIKVRMEKAKELLKFTGEKIVNIAGMCGYKEVYYFSHSFKKYTSVSPKEFRNNG